MTSAEQAAAPGERPGLLTVARDGAGSAVSASAGHRRISKRCGGLTSTATQSSRRCGYRETEERPSPRATTRSFATTIGQLETLADWLAGFGVTLVGWKRPTSTGSPSRCSSGASSAGFQTRSVWPSLVLPPKIRRLRDRTRILLRGRRDLQPVLRVLPPRPPVGGGLNRRIRRRLSLRTLRAAVYSFGTPEGAASAEATRRPKRRKMSAQARIPRLGGAQ
jgi:hypothetical protein